MLISHEVPTCLLERSTSFNDYDYCLLHLTYADERYKQFYIDSAREGRQVLLDNSIFELGKALTNDKLAQGVLDIKPTYYIVPDYLDNADITIQQFSDFIKEYRGLPGKSIGVVQRSTVDGLDRCYRYMSEHADKIALSFDSKAYGTTKEEWCIGRPAYVEHLKETGLWNYNKPHHLLGCSYAREFTHPIYKSTKNIESVDTSNPVVAGVVGLRYGDCGLDTKPTIKLCDLINTELSDTQLRDIKYNIEQFRKLCNGN